MIKTKDADEELARYKDIYETCQKERIGWKERACHYYELEKKAQATIVRQQRELEKLRKDKEVRRIGKWL